MKERIKELAEQAEQLADDELSHLERVHNRLYSFTEGREIYNQKFAELIVQECIDILPEKVKINDLYDGRILVQCGMAIKEHFGVEE